eukprot:1445259-Karenia_brevis.AAC.1
MEQQIHVMRQVILDLQHDLDATEAGHASPVLSEACAQTDQLQCGHLKVDQLQCSHLSTCAGHPSPVLLASPVLFDVFDDADLHTDVACQTDVDLGPPLQVPGDQLQRSHLSHVSASPVLLDAIVQCDLGAGLASPVLIDGEAQTSISILAEAENKFFRLNQAGHATPALFDGDFAAG